MIIKTEIVPIVVCDLSATSRPAESFAAFPEETIAAELSRAMGGIHPLMVGCWACLMQNALEESGGQHCAAVFEEGHGCIRDALHKRSPRLGAGCPPCFAEMAAEFGKGSTGPERKRRRKA